ncbi:Transposon Ty3-I Gag-Pol polyprotein [Araneus ventricosus]|uniref:RNA-directed DNA polymerase n=1 Tax=Araneus ventricosus TaxID=182803 RepID=A0A4Y2DTA4_ARAVE|nr:Transposon Ty3-I Gag-Pol polyprotein [Araneus ventricosus]
MPFGLSNAAATFQRFIHHVLSGMDLPYFDDVLVASKSEIQPLEHLKQVFQRFEVYGVRLNASKCVLAKSSVKFIGHIVTPDGITPLPEKVSAITDFPEPSTVKELRRFLALINFYRQFVPNAARTQAVLNAYLKGAKKNDKTPINWTNEAKNAFEKCKHDLAEATVLYHPSVNATLAIVVDASDNAVGAALQQQVTTGWQPLAFYSKSLSPAQRRYSASAYMVIKYFRHMVEGRSFILFTDHKPLTFAFRQKEDKCSPRQLRQLDLIGQFTTDIRHLKGTDNVVADALSRIHISTIGLPYAIDFQKMAEEQQTNPELQDILSSNTTSLVLQPLPVGEPPVTLHCDVSLGRIRPFVPENFRREVFTNLHSLSHAGIRASVRMISERYVWPFMKADVTLWARTCLQCQKAKVSRHTTSKLSDFVPPSARFEHVHIDLVGPLPPSEAFYSGWISRFGPPLRLTTDQGTQFESALFQALTKFLGTARQRTSYHPAANGQVERFHRQLKAAIMAHGKVQWSSALPTILLGFRATWKDDLEATNAEMVNGAPIRLPGEFLSPTTDSPDPSTFVGKLKEVIQRLLPPKTQHHGQHSVFVSKDLSSFSHVFLRTDALKKGLQPPYEGPFQVLDRNEKIFKINRNGKELTVNIDRVKPAYVLRDCDATRLPASEPLTPQENLQEDRTARTSRPQTVTRSGRRVRFNPRYA